MYIILTDNNSRGRLLDKRPSFCIYITFFIVDLSSLDENDIIVADENFLNRFIFLERTFMHSEINYDLKKFGNIVFQIRQQGQVTQKKIRALTGIHPDTIKNLEYGLRLPTLDTIDKLSEVYNINLLNILSECKNENDSNIRAICDKIDRMSYENNIRDIEAYRREIRDYKAHMIQGLSHQSQVKLGQMDYFLQLLEIKNKTDVTSILETQRLCHLAIRLGHPTFEERTYKDNYYSILELRLISILSISLLRQKKRVEAVDLSNYVLKHLKYHGLSNGEAKPLVLQAYYTLAYQLFVLNHHKEVIQICQEAIAYGTTNYSSKFLPHFYFRIGISKLHLKQADYKDYLDQAIGYLRLHKEDHLLTIFKETLKKTYNIIIDE